MGLPPLRASVVLPLLLPLLAALPWQPLGPFDARDWTPLPGVRLEYPLVGTLLEPLFAPAHILAGAPDFRIAILSTLLWAAAVGAVLGLARARRWRAAAAGALAAAALVLAYVVFLALVPVPGWRLVVTAPGWAVADLQTHTHGSHDGLVSAARNLTWHQERGYDLIALTEHDDPAGAFAAAVPAVVPGVEVKRERAFLLGVGLDPGQGLPAGGGAAEFVRAVHADHGGAVIALAWRLDAAQVRRLAAAGVDAFEIANNGHPDLPAPVRAALLEAGRQGVVLVASTDWHGWSGLARTWTLVRVADGQAPAAAAVAQLRARRVDAFVPVVAGYLGPPSPLRALFAPLVESVRYLAELAPERVIAWWVWAIVLLAGAQAMAGRGLRPGRVYAALWLGGTGAAVLWRALELLGSAPLPGVAEPVFAWRIGGYAVAAGLAGVGAAGWICHGEWSRARG